jgi:hypothetical protein
MAKLKAALVRDRYRHQPSEVAYSRASDVADSMERAQGRGPHGGSIKGRPGPPGWPLRRAQNQALGGGGRSLLDSRAAVPGICTSRTPHSGDLRRSLSLGADSQNAGTATAHDGVRVLPAPTAKRPVASQRWALRVGSGRGGRGTPPWRTLRSCGARSTRPDPPWRSSAGSGSVFVSHGARSS